jgi:ribonuclease HI
MELTAALEAVKAITGSLEVRSDSKYVVDCFNAKWYMGWEAKGWKGSNKKPVKNQDLLRPMVEQFHQRDGELTFTWVKGHSDDPMNDLVDRLAVEAARNQTARSGAGVPGDRGRADAPSSRSSSGSGSLSLNQIEGWRLVVFGLRPPQLGGYEPNNPDATHVRSKLAEMMAALKVVHPDLVVLTGLGLGAEMLAAEAAAEADVHFVAVLPFPNPDGVWPELTRARYRRALAGATSAVTVSKKAPRSRQEAGKALGVRNTALVAAAHGALVVWDQKDRNLGDLVRSLESRIPDDVIILAPE